MRTWAQTRALGHTAREKHVEMKKSESESLFSLDGTNGYYIKV